MKGAEIPRLQLFHQWLVATTLVVFGTFLAFDSGVYALIIDNDPSRVSILISLLFACGCAHCGILSFGLAREVDSLQRLRADPTSLRAAVRTGWTGEFGSPPSQVRNYFEALTARAQAPVAGSGGEYTQLTEVLAEKVRGQHEAGWFLTNTLVKLGLLGTVIGFILMLQSVMSIDSFDISDAQGLLGSMTVGMGVALNTTMLGLVTSMVLGMQYLLVDRGADRLIADAVLVAESQVVPAALEHADGV